jgi:hypothetical protein
VALFFTVVKDLSILLEVSLPPEESNAFHGEHQVNIFPEQERAS